MPETFSPVLIPDCISPSQEVLKVALSKDIDEKMLEARIRGVYYIVTINQQTRELIPEELHLIDDEDFLLQRDLIITQRYSIIVDLALRYTYHFSLYLSSDARELCCRIMQGSRIEKDEANIKVFFERIRVQKAEMHILMRDEKTEYERLKIFVQSLPDEKFLSKSHEFVLSRAVGGEPCVNQHLEFAVNLKIKFLLIHKDQYVATFYKGRKGGNARDCLGRFVPEQEPEQGESAPLIANDSLYITEEVEGEVKYFAREAGYIVFDGNQLMIASKIKLKNASLSTTGSILGGAGTTTHIYISSTDSLEDALGEGVVIEAGTVEVLGNVGNNAIIRANQVIIKGQTHKNSKIYAKNVDVAVHKGFIESDVAHIGRLEAGVVSADKVKIDHAYGGRSYGEELRIVVMHSNHHAHASTSIIVDSLKGEDNRFTLRANSGHKKNATYQALVAGKKQFSHELTEKQRKYANEIAELKQLQPMVKQFKEDYKNQNQNPQKLQLIREQAHTYRNILHYTEQLKGEIDTLEKRLEKIDKGIAQLEEIITESYILVKSGWHGYNEVKLKKLASGQEFFLYPKMGKDGNRISCESGSLVAKKDRL
ncbi:hypothetical protein CCZ01_05165 [Helicobacter monodelphidis]|uniref:FapA family protein n=1 Tax=Helicobacter sp. 15-1451 TaxID=2004995 RepID=UPI000DCC756B|nr:FapA family protein [Helicobacter sp. 15-1451]RAX57679.1 hypothetical protein CCZ01_05165 [Helicobacter sp. 15-1451]